MGTSFDCDITVTAVADTGQLQISIGPLDMGNMAELMEYLKSDEGQDRIFGIATKAFMGSDHDAPQVIHLRGIESETGKHTTACGLEIWTTLNGKTFAAVASIGRPDNPDCPVTCPACKAWIARHT